MNTNIKYKEVLGSILTDLHKISRPVGTKDVLENLKKEMVNICEPGMSLEDCKRLWLQRIKRVAMSLNIEITNNVHNWNDMFNISHLTENSKVAGSSSVKSGSTTHSCLSDKMCVAEKEQVLDCYKKMKEERMWKLSSGKLVEQQMMKLAESCQFEHPCHSFIFDPEDENWSDYFTLAELDELKGYSVRPMPEFPKELVEYLNRIKQTDMDDLHKSLSSEYFHPRKDRVCHWAQKCLIEGVELHMADILKEDGFNERDLLSRVWRLILLAFDHSRMTIREEKPSMASNLQINKKRKLPATTPIDRKASAKRPDQLIRFGTYEVGLTEASKAEDETSNKFFMDSMLKCPKLLKDMMIKLTEAAPHKKSSIRTVGLVASRLELVMLVMDAPTEYVHRILRTDAFKYPAVYDLFVKEIRYCLELVWMAKMILEETVDNLISPAPHQVISFKSSTKKDSLPTFYKSRK